MDLLSIFDYSQLLDVIAQTTTSSPTQTPKETVDTVTLLKTQLDFLKFIIQLAVFVFAVLGAWITFVFGKNLSDAKKVAEEIISQKVEARVDNLIKTEVQSLRKSIDREKAIIFTYVDYYLPSSAMEPKEFKLIKARGFRDVFFWNRHNPPKRLSGNVCVLDLQNYKDDKGQEFSKLSQDDKEKKVETHVNEILPLLKPETVLVIYARGRFNAIENIPNSRYYVPANSVVTLIGWVADSAYVAYGEEMV
ncbi:hypothetical protein Riv7116_3423 [Rivularia sp. PCC 7116]|uniref:hypothetical protein n=1 Tax=Rivularia sp. PCC 7116 TaxID=373994 RepID=UPI00029F1324|nr:hypothetical protein [Rivularia sp. PCC 7116]AFY55879.1 hypothetical protein Riv7116_3423 [Rivularia sp. PCC 7116]